MSQVLINGEEKLYLPTGKIHMTTEKTKCFIYAIQSEEIINSLTLNASSLGLKVNHKKLK